MTRKERCQNTNWRLICYSAFSKFYSDLPSCWELKNHTSKELIISNLFHSPPTLNSFIYLFPLFLHFLSFFLLPPLSRLSATLLTISRLFLNANSFFHQRWTFPLNPWVFQWANPSVAHSKALSFKIIRSRKLNLHFRFIQLCGSGSQMISSALGTMAPTILSAIVILTPNILIFPTSCITAEESHISYCVYVKPQALIWFAKERYSPAPQLQGYPIRRVPQFRYPILHTWTLRTNCQWSSVNLNVSVLFKVYDPCH